MRVIQRSRHSGPSWSAIWTPGPPPWWSCSRRAGRWADMSGWTRSRRCGSDWRGTISSRWAAGIESMPSETVRSIIRAYDDPVVRAYCWLRFGILRQRFLDEIGQYLPDAGPVLDIGCGFGLFSLYYAATGPRRFVRGLDLNPRRIALARR